MDRVSNRVRKIFGEANSLNMDGVTNDMQQLAILIEPLLGVTKFKQCKVQVSTDDFRGNHTKNKTFEKMTKYFGDCINWRSPQNNYNITPPVPVSTIATCAVANSINQTMVSDIACGNFAAMELSIVKYISELANWNSKKSSGVFTFGGTGTNLYGCKIGTNKANKRFANKGVKNVVVFDSDQAHSSHKTVVDWLGIGLDNNIIMSTIDDLIDMRELRDKLTSAIEQQKTIGCINLSGGTTYNGQIDDIQACSKIIDKLVKQYSLDYRPHLHVDAVIGWVYLFFKNYDFKKNKLGFSNETKLKIQESTKKILNIKYADSFGVDFHKTGFATYSSSLFMLQNKQDWDVISKGAVEATHQAFELGNYSPGKFTLETSRGVNGPVSAYTNIVLLGETGFQESIGILKEFSESFRKIVNQSNEFSVCNNCVLGWATLITLNPKGTKIDFDELINSHDKSFVKEVSMLQKKFFDFIYCEQKDFEWYVSFSKSYRKNKIFGTDLAALKVFPMSPLITTNDSNKYFKWLIKKRREFYAQQKD